MSSIQTQSKDILNPQTLIIHKGKFTPVNGLFFSFLHFYIRETTAVDPHVFNYKPIRISNKDGSRAKKIVLS